MIPAEMVMLFVLSDYEINNDLKNNLLYVADNVSSPPWMIHNGQSIMKKIFCE
jgi:hypothetical protein